MTDHRNLPPAPKSLNRADRRAHDALSLRPVTTARPGLPPSGPIPAGLYGHLFVNTAVGTVTSGGLPLRGAEVTTMLAGDAYMMRFDLSPQGVTLKSRLLETPCYWLDKATAERKNLKMYRFFNHGILRFNWLVGARNMNNTAFYSLPKKDAAVGDACRLLATWDAGPPWEIDPITLEAKTPIGKRSEWTAEALGTYTFPVMFTTAHPQWDPDTQQLFSVNYGKGLDGLMTTVPIMKAMSLARGFTHLKVDRFLSAVGADGVNKARHAAALKLDNARTRLQDASEAGFLPQRFTHLLRWDGRGALEHFQVRHRLRNGQLGGSIGISETTHQIACSKHFVVILDTGFKVGLDALYGDPFPFIPSLSAVFKTVVTRAVTPYSTFYIVRRSELDESKAAWDAKSQDARDRDRTPDVGCITVRMPSAACHFIMDYDDDGNRVVLHVAHSDATDVGEWVRGNARNPYHPKEEVDPDYFGLPGITGVDSNKVARYVVDVKERRVAESSILSRSPFSWTIALYAEQSAGLPRQFSNRVKHLFWNSIGFFPQLATLELHQLYKHYIHRSTLMDEIEMMEESGGRPSTLFCLDTEANMIVDAYILPPGFTSSSPQFLPRKGGSKHDRDGYMSLMVFPPDPAGGEAVPELWLFDAANLQGGPLCMLASPELKVGFTIHSAWLGALQHYDPNVYRVDVAEDLRPTLDNRRRGPLKKLFEDEIFPKFAR